MVIDLARADVTAHTLSAPSGFQLDSQVCIIGGGIAGLTLARALALDGPTPVTLLEAGGYGAPNLDETQDPFAAELNGRPHDGTREGRVRALGGSSLVWGGQLLPLPDDAEWPVTLPERSPQETYAAESLWAAHHVASPPLLKTFPELNSRLARFLPFSDRNLLRAMGKELRASTRLRVVLHAHVTELILSPTGDRVERAVVHAPGGRRWEIQAEQFVLAAGTVETCRLLLASRSVMPCGIGNAFDKVGRNFHDHLTMPAAEFTGSARARVLDQLRPWLLRRPGARRNLYSLKLEAGPQLRSTLRLHPIMAHLTIEEPANVGIGLLRDLLRARQRGSFWGTLRTHAGEVPGTVARGLRLVWEAWVRQRRYVSPEARVFLQLNTAQDAPSASRVLLSEQRDSSGMPLACVAWQVTAAELRTLRRFAQYLRERLTEAGFSKGVVWQPALFADGSVADEELLRQIDDARHAMGGACIGTDPRTSVADPELRVHGVANLSLASAAVFPDGSAQLPTATLLALCKRLAERLQREVGR